MTPDTARLLLELLLRQQLSAAADDLVETAQAVAQARRELEEVLAGSAE